MQSLPSLYTQTKLYSPTEEECYTLLVANIADGESTSGFKEEDDYLYWIMRGLARGLKAWFNDVNKTAYQIDYSKADFLLPLHEKLHGIPNKNIPLAETVEERRRNVLIAKLKILSANITDIASYEDYLRKQGLVLVSIVKIIIEDILDSMVFPRTYPVYYGPTIQYQNRYRVTMYDGEEYEENNRLIKYELEEILKPTGVTWEYVLVQPD